MSEAVKREDDVPAIDRNALVHPYVMQQIAHMRDRITQQNRTMEMMWGRWERMFERESWLREAYPEIIEQHKALEDLKRAGKQDGAKAFGRAIPKAEGQQVNHDGNI